MPVSLCPGVYAYLMAAIIALSVPVPAAHAAADTAPTTACHSVAPPTGFDAARVGSMQKELAGLPVGGRIARFAESFIGTPYDTDPLGAYVRKERVVCDSEVDCMYLVFRAVELATSDTPEGAVERALDLRFITKGVIEDGRVTNYDERFQYAEDMVASGKWGGDVTATLGTVKAIPGARGRETITYMPAKKLAAPEALGMLRGGDLIFFVKDPSKRVAGEVIGHLGIVDEAEGGPYLVHASGNKDRPDRSGGGIVKKVSLRDYLMDTKFIGVQVTRFR